MSRPQRAVQRMRNTLAACAWVVMLAGSCGDDDDGTDATVAKDGGRDSGPGVDGRAGLADDTAGQACARDADCPGGRCVELPAMGTAYCSASCTSTAQCGHGGLCVPSSDPNDGAGATPAAKECLGACMTSADCRDDYVCFGALVQAQFPVLGSCRPRQAVDALGDDVAGRACGGDDECTGGRCASLNPLGVSYPGNYCTGRCYLDADCGQGGVCLAQPDALDAGYCLQRCESEADCSRDGYRCWELAAGGRLLHACFPGADPFPDRLTGKPCTADEDCAGRPGACVQELPFLAFANGDPYPAAGGYCTQPCSFDADCGAGAQCLAYSARGGLCFASCSEDQPCRDGYTCLAHLRDGDPEAQVCVPPMPNADADAGP